MFGLPAVTSLFVFGGFLVPLALAVWFGLRFRADTDEWLTLGSAPSAPVPNPEKAALLRGTDGDLR
jgi:hypothetical protein